MLDVGNIESLIAPALPFRRGRGDGRLIEARTKNSIMKRSFSLIVAAMVAMLVNAVAPNGSGTYYQNANGMNGAALKTALCDIIYNRTEKSYNYLWTAFRTTDKTSDGMVWDMYSDMTNYEFGGPAQGANYSKEGDSYNREHSFPKSWFGGEVMPMYTDLHHMYPTDGFVNNKRGNYPFGETNGNSYKSHNDFSKLGSCTYPGYTGTVFEPADEYKGDFARTYFYMVTCYEEKLHDWYSKNSESRATIDGSKYPGFQTWQLNMLLEWAAADQVSDKETARNNAVAGIQGNRNPFIDYPGLEQYIWGSKKDDTFSYNNYVLPTEYAGYNSGSGSGGQGGEMTGDSYVKVTSTASLTSGQYLIVYEEGSVVFDGSLTALDAAGNTQSVSISNNAIAATTTINGYAFTYDATSKTLKSASGYYIGQTSDANGMASNTSTTYTNTITIDENGNADIVSGSAHLRYNNANDQNRFRYYKSSSYTGQKAIQLYKFVEGVKADPIFNGLADVSVDWGSALTLTKGTTGTPNIVTNGDVTLSSLNEDVVSVSGLTITPVAVGTTMIIVNTSATTTYNAGSVMFPITVNAPEGKETAKPSESGLLFGETFGNNSSSARVWDDSYSVKSGVLSVYSGITGYTITNAKQSKNNTGSTLSGLIQTTPGTDASVIIGPLNVTSYSSLYLTYQWKAGSIGGTYSTKAYYATSSNGTYSELTGTGNGATTFVERAYSLPAAAQVSTLYLKIVWNTSNTNGVIDEVRLTGSSPSTLSVTLKDQGYATYCSEYPLDFSDNETADYSAWQVTGVNGTAITFAQITGSIKGGQGILLKGEAGATIELTSVDSENVLNGNLLEGTLVPWFVETDQYYGLSGKKFVKVKPGTVSAGKALLPASILGGNDIKAYTFEFEDEATAIKTVDNGQLTTDGVIYNLAGQRLGRMQKGINIVNGKKILF